MCKVTFQALGMLLFALVVSRGADLNSSHPGDITITGSATGVPDGVYYVRTHITASPSFNGQTDWYAEQLPLHVVGGVVQQYIWGGHMPPYSPSSGAWVGYFDGVAGHPEIPATGTLPGFTWDYSQPENGNLHKQATVTIGTEPPCPEKDLTFYLPLRFKAKSDGFAPEGSYVIVFKIDGEVKSTQGVTVPGGVKGDFVQTVSAGPIHTPGEFSYEWDVNGIPVRIGTIACADEPQFNQVWSPERTVFVPDGGSQSGSSSSSSGGNSTSTGTTSTGGTGPSAGDPNSGGGATGSGSVNVGGGGSEGGSTVTQNTTVNNGGTKLPDATNQDFYNDMKQAFTDAGMSGSYPNLKLPNTTVDPGDTSDDGGAGTLQDIGESAKEARDGVQQALTSQVIGLQAKVGQIPTHFGQVGTFSLGSILNHEIVIDLQSGPVGSKIPLIRLCFLWMLSVLWVFMCINAIRQYI